MVERDGAWINDAKIAAGRDINQNTIPLKCEPDGVLDVNATISGIFGPIDVIVDNIVPVSQSGTWTVNLANEPTIDIGIVDQGASGTDPWKVEVTNFPASQTVNGTLTVLQGTSPWVVSGSITTSPNVNVHDGTGVSISSTGSSLNVDVTNTIPVSQATSPWIVNGSGFTQPISAVSLPLPTGASTSANQTNGSQKSQIVDGANTVVGPVQTVSGINYLPVVLAASGTNGSVVPTRTILVGGSDGTNLRSFKVSTTGVLSVDNSANIQPITITPGDKATYVATVGFYTPPASAFNFWRIAGSATKLVRVTRLLISGTRTTSANNDLMFVRQSTLDTGMTTTTAGVAKYDSTNPTATASVLAYTTNPTVYGTGAGIIRMQKQFLNAPATGASDIINYSFGDNPAQAVVLRGVNENLVLNLFGTTPAGASYDICVEWTEE